MSTFKNMLTVGIRKKKKMKMKKNQQPLFPFWADHQKEAILLTKVISHSLVKSNFHIWFITIAIN